MSIIPYVIEQTGRGERSYDIFSRLLSDRIIFLGEEVTDVFASTIIAQVAADTERDNYMSAQEALAYGLIDKIIDKR